MLLLLVFAIKGALVPLQFWLPATYARAPGPVAALFAVMTKVGAYAVIRVFTLIFPPDTPATGTLFADLLLPAALVTLVLGAVGVLGAASLARLVAFAAIASMGTLFIAIAQFTPQATAAALYYLIHSTLAGATLFLVADLVPTGAGRRPAPGPAADRAERIDRGTVLCRGHRHGRHAAPVGLSRQAADPRCQRGALAWH